MLILAEPTIITTTIDVDGSKLLILTGPATIGSVGDNIAQRLKFVFASEELKLKYADYTTMQVQLWTAQETFIPIDFDATDPESWVIDITNRLSAAATLNMQVIFTRDHVDPASVVREASLQFARTLRPVINKGDAPIDPKPNSWNEFVGEAFSGAEADGGTITFKNIQGEVVGEVEVTAGTATDISTNTAVIGVNPGKFLGVDENGKVTGLEGGGGGTGELSPDTVVTDILPGKFLGVDENGNLIGKDGTGGVASEISESTAVAPALNSRILVGTDVSQVGGIEAPQIPLGMLSVSRRGTWVNAGVELPANIIDFSKTWTIQFEARMAAGANPTSRNMISVMVPAGVEGGGNKGFSIYASQLESVWRLMTQWRGTANNNVNVLERVFTQEEWFTITLSKTAASQIRLVMAGDSIETYSTTQTVASVESACNYAQIGGAKIRIGTAGPGPGVSAGISGRGDYRNLKIWDSNLTTGKPVAEYRFENSGANQTVIDSIGGFNGTNLQGTDPPDSPPDVVQSVTYTMGINREALEIDQVDNVKQLPATYDSNQDDIVDTASALEFGIITYKHDESNPVLVSFTSDDGNAYDYTRMKPLFDARGWPLNLAIITSLINTPNYLTESQLKELHALGWSIASHTHSHLDNPRLTGRSIEVVEYEMAQAQAILKSLGCDYDLLVWPFGDANPQIRRIARNYYNLGVQIGAWGSYTANNYPGSIENLSVWRRNGMGEGSSTLQTCKNIIDTAITANNGNWVVFMNHAASLVSGGYLDTGAHAGEYEELLDYTKTLEDAGDLRVVNYREGLALRGNILEAGDFEDNIYTRIARNGLMKAKGGITVA